MNENKEVIGTQQNGRTRKSAGTPCYNACTQFQTPLWVCEYMAGMLPDGTITVLEPTPGQGNIVSVLTDYDVTAPQDFFELETDYYDAVVMNPPFSPMKKGYEIMYSCMERSDTIIALMPWLVMINSAKRTKDIMDFGLKSITHLPRKVFDGSRVQTCVLEMSKGFSGNTKFVAL